MTTPGHVIRRRIEAGHDFERSRRPGQHCIGAYNYPVRRFQSALAGGLLAGVIDALLVHRPVGLRLATALFFLPLVWIVWCLLVRALFLLRPLQRWADAAVIAAGPGLVLTSRLYPALRNIEVPSVVSGAICAATVAVLRAGALRSCASDGGRRNARRGLTRRDGVLW